MNIISSLHHVRYLVCQILNRHQGKKFASQVRMKVFTQKKNPITGSTEWDVQHEDYDFHQEIARSAFADMLHDTERNKKYNRALQLAIDKMHADGRKANVLDIGTGTGLLSIMAARCGADSIVACEAFKPVAECCLKILQSNGVADKITVIPKRSTDLTVGENGDMKMKANILVTEVFDTELIGEGALATFSHAHECLLEEDSIVVPDSAVIYAQVVECPTLQKWNKLNDLADEDLEIILKTPQKMKECPGSAAVHDLQLSQLPRQAFRELSEQIPVFYYDWSGRTPVDKQRTVKQTFTVANTGCAQVVFMWWELNMDTEGKICLSCAPWWAHPDVDAASERPQDTIPWRDHWMQAVYYLPKQVQLQKDAEVTLVSCQDEYSLWFYLEDEKTRYKDYKRPICDCGVHMIFSRTHVSYLNDGKRSKKFLARLKEEIDPKSVVLDLNGGSFMGLAAAKIGAKYVYILESMTMASGILNDYAKENSIENVKIIPEVEDNILNEVTHLICDPNFTSAILPWENLKMAYLLYKFKGKLKNVSVMPEGCEFWAMPVEFQDLHKIRVPLKRCEGIDMSIFDALVEAERGKCASKGSVRALNELTLNHTSGSQVPGGALCNAMDPAPHDESMGSRDISDADTEAQPLWEYPCRCRGHPQRILQLDMTQLEHTYARNDSHSVIECKGDEVTTVNGFAIWAVWFIGGKPISSGPIQEPQLGDIVEWDPHTRQAVKILEQTHQVTSSDSWSYQIACDLEKGQFNLRIELVKAT